MSLTLKPQKVMKRISMTTSMIFGLTLSLNAIAVNLNANHQAIQTNDNNKMKNRLTYNVQHSKGI